MYELAANNDLFCHEWGDSAMIFTSDEVTREIIAESPHEWQKSSSTVTNYYFILTRSIM